METCRNLLSIAFLCLAAVAGVSVHSASRRSKSAELPCFSVVPPTVDVMDMYLQMILKSLTVLKLQSESLFQRMEMTYCLNLSQEEKKITGFIDISSFNAARDSRAFLQDFCTNTTAFLIRMRGHYDSLNELANYLEELRLTGVDDSSQGVLTFLLEDIYDCMCPVKAALRSRNQEPVVKVPNGTLSETFVNYRKRPITSCRQQTAEYISVHDSRRIVTYLATVYSRFNTSVSKCL